MAYNKKQIDVVVNLLPPEMLINFLMGVEFTYTVTAAMELSHDSDGNLTPQDLLFIEGLIREDSEE